MQRFRKATAAAFLALGASFASVSCVDNDSSLFIYGVMDIESTQCLASADASAVFIPRGILDRAFSDGYQAVFMVGSHLTQRGSRENLRTETSRLSITGAHVTLYGTSGQEISFDTPATGLVNPASGTDPGLATVFTQIVRPDDVNNLGEDGQFIARVKILGTTLGGQDIESGAYDYPITLCEGCLIYYPPEALDDSSGNYLCDAGSGATAEASICFVGQDRPIPCTYCASFSDICADPLANPFYNPTDPAPAP